MMVAIRCVLDIGAARWQRLWCSPRLLGVNTGTGKIIWKLLGCSPRLLGVNTGTGEII